MGIIIVYHCIVYHWIYNGYRILGYSHIRGRLTRPARVEIGLGCNPVDKI